MTNQTNEAEYEDVKGRVELQRHVLAQLHMAEADASKAEASLNALLEDEASKLRVLDYLRKWRGDKLEGAQVDEVTPEKRPPFSTG
jgi:hypothetical protein